MVQLGEADDDWIARVAAAGLVAIVRDKHVFTRWWENELQPVALAKRSGPPAREACRIAVTQ
jgi:hypothetical protein